MHKAPERTTIVWPGRTSFSHRPAPWPVMWVRLAEVNDLTRLHRVFERSSEPPARSPRWPEWHQDSHHKVGD